MLSRSCQLHIALQKAYTPAFTACIEISLKLLSAIGLLSTCSALEDNVAMALPYIGLYQGCSSRHVMTYLMLVLV